MNRQHLSKSCCHWNFARLFVSSLWSRDDCLFSRLAQNGLLYIGENKQKTRAFALIPPTKKHKIDLANKSKHTKRWDEQHGQPLCSMHGIFGLKKYFNIWHIFTLYIYVFFRYFFQRFRHPLAVYFPHAWMKNLPARKYWPYKQRALQVLFCENTVAAWVIWELGMWKKHVWPQLFLDLCRCLVDTMADEKAKSLPTEWLAILSCDKERMAAKQIMEDQRPVEVIYIYIYLILFHLYFP